METSSTKVSVTSSVSVSVSRSIWIASRQVSTMKVGLVRIVVRIWHRVPKWKGGSDADAVGGGPAPLDDTTPHPRRCHRVVHRPRFCRGERRRHRTCRRYLPPHTLSLLRVQKRNPLGRVRHPPRTPTGTARQRRPESSAGRGAAGGAVGVQHF